MAQTSARLLRLLSLLQTPREWPGPELADRLGVSDRTVRNDVERLRALGYPVEATRGPVGGYRLSAGTAMPPLLLDDDEAVAIAVTLSTSGNSVEGAEESAMRALTKLMQVLPKRLGGRVDALRAHTVRVGPRRHTDGGVDGAVLALVAGAARDREIIRFGYAAHDGTATERRVEPYRLVNMGRRWYAVAFDVERADWRTFRVDRITEARSVGHRFRARELPAEDIAAYVADKTRSVQMKTVGQVVLEAPADQVEMRMGSWAQGSIEVLGPDRCRMRIGGRTPEQLAFWLGAMECDFTIEDSPELAEAVRAISRRYARAVS